MGGLYLITIINMELTDKIQRETKLEESLRRLYPIALNQNLGWSLRQRAYTNLIQYRNELHQLNPSKPWFVYQEQERLAA